MKLLRNNREALKKDCPYCGVITGEYCKVIGGNNFTNGFQTRNTYGQPLVHNKRVSRITK